MTPPKPTRHNGTAIRAFRIAKGLSVQELCNKVVSGGRNFTPPALRNIELENRDAKADLIQRIANALDVPIAAIIRIPISEWDTGRKVEDEAA
jgi:transcriptional regulator with XRE-family HTH domain